MRQRIGLLLILLVLFLPLSVSASPIQSRGNNDSTLNEQLNIWTEGINYLAPTVSNLFSALFTIMFLFGAVRLGYSIVTKTGQVMKDSTGLLIWVPITFFSIRALMLLLFTTDKKGVTLLASDFIRLITKTSFSTIHWMISIGIIFYIFFHLINHPEFGRWSKRMWGMAGVLILLTILAPIVLGAL